MSEIAESLKNPGSIKFQEELTKTYFSKNTPKENHFITPSHIKKNNKIYGITITAGIAIFTALFILAALILLLNRVEIRINVYPGPGTDSSGTRTAEEVYLNKDGDINKNLIRDVIFYGNSTRDSRWGKEVILANEAGSKKAAVGINLIRPIDMEKNLLSLSAKGKTGEEDFRIYLKDTGDNICYSRVIRLNNGWQSFILNIEQARNLIDTANISRIDFEINPDEKPAASSSVVHFKNICFIKKGE